MPQSTRYRSARSLLEEFSQKPDTPSFSSRTVYYLHAQEQPIHGLANAHTKKRPSIPSATTKANGHSPVKRRHAHNTQACYPLALPFHLRILIFTKPPPCTLPPALIPLFVVMPNLRRRETIGESCLFARRSKGTSRIWGDDRTESELPLS